MSATHSDDKQNIFRGTKIVSTAVSNQTRSETMASAPPQQSLSLSSLATALEPGSTSSTQQKTSVGSFTQRSMPPSSEKQLPPFSQQFGQASTDRSNQQFSYSNAPSTNSAGFSQNPAVTNIPTMSFTNSSQSPRISQKNPSTSPPSEMRRWTEVNEEEEPSEAPLSKADASLLAKKTNTTLVDSSTLVIDRSDPTSPLFSVKSFQDLQVKPELLKGIYGMGFQAPSKIQEITLPHLLGNPPRNIIAQSQSGTGKTAAFSIALLSRIDPSIKSVQALILAPTFELAIQVGSVIESLAKYLPYVTVAYAVRNTTAVQMPNLTRGHLLAESIVIGTPGTVEDWSYKKKVIDLQKLRICCIDEADVMIATEGFQKLCVNLVNHLNPATSQIMLFSATYSDEVMEFARQIVPNPVVLRLKREKQTLQNIRQFFIKCYSLEQKFQVIEEIYNHLITGQAMIFCRTKATAHDLGARLANQNHSVRVLTSALEIEVRAAIIRQFRERIFNVLISTNVTSRGIDIDDVALVINYDMPITNDQKPDFETYLHRIGRCGRFGKLGNTFNLIGSEKDMNVMIDIQQYFRSQITEVTIEQIHELADEK